jgi:hypothetical protein
MITTTSTNDFPQAAPALLTHSNDFTFPKGSIAMNLIQEDLARAHMDARLSQAREVRRSTQLIRAKRLNRRAERASQRARLLLARSI